MAVESTALRKAQERAVAESAVLRQQLATATEVASVKDGQVQQTRWWENTNFTGNERRLLEMLFVDNIDNLSSAAAKLAITQNQALALINSALAKKSLLLKEERIPR